MANVPLEIGTGFYQSASLPLSAQRCINLYPVIPQAAALSQRALFGCPGTKTFSATFLTIYFLFTMSTVVISTFFTIVFMFIMFTESSASTFFTIDFPYLMFANLVTTTLLTCIFFSSMRTYTGSTAFFAYTF